MNNFRYLRFVSKILTPSIKNFDYYSRVNYLTKEGNFFSFYSCAIHDFWFFSDDIKFLLEDECKGEKKLTRFVSFFLILNFKSLFDNTLKYFYSIMLKYEKKSFDLLLKIKNLITINDKYFFFLKLHEISIQTWYSNVSVIYKKYVNNRESELEDFELQTLQIISTNRKILI
ncbi:cap-binding protein [Guillardia theta]|uniref:Cap-binding protein n=1 Tax=Guillardia theta TaxID=55529 RepID=Q9AW56_GUITH|nr:cap-binding protein [Guillardia theta]CAC27014.1 cap-binding protein [Guillardia theta]